MLRVGFCIVIMGVCIMNAGIARTKHARLGWLAAVAGWFFSAIAEYQLLTGVL